MNAELMQKAWCMPLSATRKFVLIALCYAANEDGICSSSVATIARMCCLTDRAVLACIAKLESEGYIRRDQRAGRRSNYVLLHESWRVDLGDETANCGKEQSLNPTPEQYSPLNNIHPCTTFTPEQYSGVPLNNIQGSGGTPLNNIQGSGGTPLNNIQGSARTPEQYSGVFLHNRPSISSRDIDIYNINTQDININTQDINIYTQDIQDIDIQDIDISTTRARTRARESVCVSESHSANKPLSLEAVRREAKVSREAFERIRAAYPKFAGRQDWINAEAYCRALVDNGESWDTLLEAAQRYARYIRATEREGTQYVMTPGRFFSARDMPWRQPWDVPQKQKQNDSTSFAAMMAALDAAVGNSDEDWK
jgi:hypothetical protein